MPNTPTPPEPGQTILQREPVMIAFAFYGLLTAILSALTLAGVIDETLSGTIGLILIALYGFVSQMFVRPNVYAKEPLDAYLAAADDENSP